MCASSHERDSFNIPPPWKTGPQSWRHLRSRRSLPCSPHTIVDIWWPAKISADPTKKELLWLLESEISLNIWVVVGNLTDLKTIQSDSPWLKGFVASQVLSYLTRRFGEIQNVLKKNSFAPGWLHPCKKKVYGTFAYLYITEKRFQMSAMWIDLDILYTITFILQSQQRPANQFFSCRPLYNLKEIQSNIHCFQTIFTKLEHKPFQLINGLYQMFC